MRFLDKFKKGYVSMSTVIVAAMVITFGAVATNRLVFQGQKTTDKSETTFQQTAETVQGGSGGVDRPSDPGPEGGSSRPEDIYDYSGALNDYGFYFEMMYMDPYSTTYAVIHQDFSITINALGADESDAIVVPAEYISYSANTIDLSAIGYGTIFATNDGLILNAPDLDMNFHATIIEEEYAYGYSMAFMSKSYLYNDEEDSWGVIVLDDTKEYYGKMYAEILGKPVDLDYTFYGCYNLKEFNIPNDIKDIGYASFYRCHSLEKIVIPESVELIDSFSFQDCTSLKSLNLPSSVTRINCCAFQRCNSLSSVNLSNVLAIEYYAFEDCNLTEIQLSNNINLIDTRAFFGNHNLSSVKYNGKNYDVIADLNNALKAQDVQLGDKIWERTSLLQGLTDKHDEYGLFDYGGNQILSWNQLINEYGFDIESDYEIKDTGYTDEGGLKRLIEEQDFYTSIKKIITPDGISRIGNGTFAGLGAQEIIISEGPSVIGAGAFSDVFAQKVEIPNSVKTIKDGAFTSTHNLKSINLKNTENIGDKAFWGSGVKIVLMPNVKKIDGFDFTEIEYVVVGKNLNEIVSMSFNGSTLSRIYYLGSEEDWANVKYTYNLPEGVVIHYNALDMIN